MARKHKVFTYSELMNALDNCKRKDVCAGIVVLALDSWRAKVLSNYAMSAVLNKCAEKINLL